MKWYRFWTDVPNDIKMLQLSDYEYRLWTYLMCYAADINTSSGELQTTFKGLSLHFHQRFNLFSRACETFQRLGLISTDLQGYVKITNWSKRQFRSDNTYERVKKYRDIKAKRNVSVTAPDTDTDTDKRYKNLFVEGSDELRLAELLYGKILQRDPLYKKPKFQSWAKNVDLLIRKDGRTAQEIERVICWCQEDVFWQQNILSTAKLREKYTQLKLKMEGQLNGERPNGRRDAPGSNRIPEYNGIETPVESPEDRERGKQALEQIRKRLEAHPT